ncbi:MAG: AmmeMemoRadiSam system protein B [Anaerolineales bacterium]
MAGKWYPDHPEELAGIIDSYLKQVRPVDGVPVALIVPHAGYYYSGSVAAHGFKQIESANIDTAVVIASDHQPPRSRPISVWSKGGYETPLGVLPVNEQLATRLIDHDTSIRFDPETHSNEHPVEIELPFLKQVSPECRIVPVMIGECSDEAVRVLAEALLDTLPDEGVVVIASSDLSHYPAYEHALEVDEATLVAIELGDPAELKLVIQENMARGIPNLATCACGEAPIRVAMQVAAGRGAETIGLLHYSNSGNVEDGDRGRVVGYGAVMFWHYEAPELTEDHKRALLQVAREAVAAYVRMGEIPQDPVAGPELERLSAVFVTLRQEGMLRGCIGQVRADTPLYQAAREKAVAAATSDPRFPALRESELNEISYEISILSPMDRITSKSEVEVGTHGVAVNQGNQRAVLLPKVAADRDWKPEILLENLYVKAGLPNDGWKDPAGLYRFTTIEIGES